MPLGAGETARPGIARCTSWEPTDGTVAAPGPPGPAEGRAVPGEGSGAACTGRAGRGGRAEPLSMAGAEPLTAEGPGRAPGAAVVCRVTARWRGTGCGVGATAPSRGTARCGATGCGADAGPPPPGALPGADVAPCPTGELRGAAASCRLTARWISSGGRADAGLSADAVLSADAGMSPARAPLCADVAAVDADAGGAASCGASTAR